MARMASSWKRRGGRPAVRAALALASALLAGAAAGVAPGPSVPEASAQTGFAARVQAKKLEREGTALFEAGDYDKALEKLDKAWSLDPQTPLLGIKAARCYERLGRLVEAAKRYDEVLAIPLPPNAPTSLVEAQGVAEAERTRLLPRIPRVTIRVGAHDTEGMTATLDGKPLAEERLGVPIPVDPGAHEAQAERGGRRASEKLTLREGQILDVVLDLQPPKQQTGGTGWTPWRSQRSIRQPVGWAVLGVGGAVLTAGAIAGGLAIGAKNDLDGSCPDSRCPPSAWEDVDRYDTLRVLTTVGLSVGAAGVATGVVLLVTAPKERVEGEPAAASARVSPWIAPGSAGVRGRF